MKAVLTLLYHVVQIVYHSGAGFQSLWGPRLTPADPQSWQLCNPSTQYKYREVSRPSAENPSARFIEPEALIPYHGYAKTRAVNQPQNYLFARGHGTRPDRCSMVGLGLLPRSDKSGSAIENASYLVGISHREPRNGWTLSISNLGSVYVH